MFVMVPHFQNIAEAGERHGFGDIQKLLPLVRILPKGELVEVVRKS